MRRLHAFLLSVALALAGSGCLLGPDFETPEVPVPAGYRTTLAEGESFANLPWWEVFQDEGLCRLIDTALEANKDLRITLARIDEARAALGFTRSDQYPSLRYGAEAARTDPSDNTFGVGPPVGPFNSFAAGLDVFFEVDLWGRLRRATEAAAAELLATEAAHRTVTIALIADVASTYLLLRDLDQRLQISLDTLQSRRRSLRIIRDRFEGGVGDMLDVHQAEIEEATAEVAVAAQERQIAETENALSVLLGRNPGVIPRGARLDAQALPPDVPVGLPSELLRRRPDIQTAEALAHAQTARIGVAEALRFPSLSLTGALGLESEDLEDLVESESRFWSIGASLAGPLFEFDRNTRRVEVEAARARAAVLEYERTVLLAFREVEDALVAVRTYRREYEARTRQVTAARGAARLARALYDEEFTSYLEVLDSERSLYDAELAESTALREHFQAIVRLYKALGGGWTLPPAPEPGPAERVETGEGGAGDG